MLPSFTASSALLASSVLLFAQSCGTGIPSSSKPLLIGGTEATANQFPGVVYLRNGCTAAKIGPRAFLTAAHCVVDYSKNELRPSYAAGSRFEVSTSIRLDGTATWVPLTIEKTQPHPSYRVADAHCTGTGCYSIGGESFDVAIVRVNEDSATVPTAGYSYDTIAENSAVTILGYGCEISTSGARPNPSRLKYQNLTTLPQSDLDDTSHPFDSETIFRHNFLTPGDSYTTSNNASLCPGDSGGPVLRLKNGAYQVVGINAYYSFPAGSGVSYSNWHTRLNDPYVSYWINGNRSASTCSVLAEKIYTKAKAGGTFKFDLAGSKIRSGNVQHSSYGYAENLTAELAGTRVKLPVEVAFSDRNNFDRANMDAQEIWVDRSGAMRINLVTWGGTVLPMQNLVCDENGQVSGITREGNGVTNITATFVL